MPNKMHAYTYTSSFIVLKC